MDGAEFDYVIIGAGSAGAVLAARLSEDPATTVCLIEAGSRDRNPLIHIPIGLSFLLRFKSTDWGYETVPQPNLNGRRLFWPRGRTLGGSSSLNAMCYTRGVPADYDEWASLGAKGWDWTNVLPYFRKAEDQQRGANSYHGENGPLTVANLRRASPMSLAFIDAGAELQLGRNTDFNGPMQEGVGLYQVTQRNGQRCSTAVAYLRVAMKRPNLAVFTRSLAQKILFDGHRASGVQLSCKGIQQTVKARREILCCGGTINTPQLLMLSGIGPAKHLSDLGITTLVDRPGVGQNLQDHLDIMIQGRSRSRAGYGIAPTMVPRALWGLFSYGLRRRGLLTSNVAEAGGFVRVSPDERFSDVQFHFLPARMRDHGRKTVWGYGYSLHTCCLRPESRGEIRLASADPMTAPLIDPRYLFADNDVQTMLKGMRLARRLLEAPAFAQFHGAELEPGSAVQSDADLLAFICEKAETIYHPIGTCRMGATDDAMAVVDPELRVIGVDGLRVVDASVMPTLIRGNTNAPTIMIGERAADLIRQRSA
jgi:choline dehydrogenase